MLIDTLKSDLITARKGRDQASISILSTLIGEMSANATLVDGVKVVNDEMAVKTLKKFLKGIEETLERTPDNTDLIQERAVIERYLPKTLSESEITSILSDAKDAGHGNIGAMMNFMKTNYPNQYDGKLASQIANNLLKGN